MATDKEDLFRYDKMVEKALRYVVRQALEEMAQKGPVGEHHFYITFFTKHEGVSIPPYLKERYPDEMTIVLQHQFHDLKVFENDFSVVLSFNSVPENLVIPFSAVTIFADPSVNFALQFQPLSGDDDDLMFEEEKVSALTPAVESKKGEVVSLANFRKKDDGAKAVIEKAKEKKEPKAKSSAKAEKADKAKLETKTTKPKTKKDEDKGEK